MKTYLGNNDDIFDKIALIKKLILLNDFEKAHALLATLLVMDVENPRVYNLLGICYEKEGVRQKASKFYRVSCFMDQSYIASSHNLMRTCGFRYDGFVDVDWGLKDLGGITK